MVASSRSSGACSSRVSPETPGSEASSTAPPDEEPSIAEIDTTGDLVLYIEHEKQSEKLAHSFRVSSKVLKDSSKYFDRLLQPGRFGEATNVAEKHESLRQEYGSPEKAPVHELPVLNIVDLGRISNVKAIDGLLTDFLTILHGKEIQAVPPIGNLANLAVVADRFDALYVVKLYMTRRKILRGIDGRTIAKIETGLPEERVRQRLLVAILLDHPLWVERYSLRLVVKGWVGKEAELSSALWWDLPRRIEEELAFRRECILDTIQSLQSHFLGLYTSRSRQCKLGYDSSAQCDSFQLGEMIRFFTRTGTLRLQGTLLGATDEPGPYEGDLFALLESFAQVNEYQIDRFHSHCGIRTRLLPLLDYLHAAILKTSICLECADKDRQEYSWIDAKRPLLWKRETFVPKDQGCLKKHASFRELFMANERDWST